LTTILAGILISAPVVGLRPRCELGFDTDFPFHDLRHTYASHLAMRGVHIRALQELLGHKTLVMTQRYSHLAPEQLQNAVKLLDGVIGEGGS
jgi:integrase